MERVISHMNWPVISVGQGCSVAAARAKIGHYNVDRLPVIDITGNLVGIVSTIDLADAEHTDSIESYLTRDVISISPLASLDRAMELLCEHDVGGLPVIVDNMVVGVLTWSDLHSAENDNIDSRLNTEKMTNRQS